MSSRLAVDIGGTFTDVVLEDGATSHAIKVLTTPDAPERAVLEGVRAILAEAKCRPQDVTLVVHGTTLATNALIERKGARTALITTEGFRDSVEMAWEHRFEQYDIHMERPQPLVPRDLRFGVPERVASDGAVLLALDEAAVRGIASRLKAEKIEAVAVCFLHSFTNEAHERRAGEILAEALPGVAISLSCEVCPEIREYERTSTTIANAYVLPRMAGYLGQLEADLKTEGIAGPLLLMMSSGGITTVDTARRYPVRLVESGPAGGAILARTVAAENDARKAVAFDMGGTTAKLTLLDDLDLQRSRQFEVARAYRFVQGSGLPVRIPVIELVEIGAGGGSIARLDALGRIQVGPDSAGSVPGPACYGRGGIEPTVTDADTALGRLDPTRFAGGAIPLHRDRAEAALQALAEPLGTNAQGAAGGVAEIVDETMASAARVHAVENGKDTADRTLIAFGGAAPLHAARLARKLGMKRVIVPVGAGVGSAFGFLRASIAYEVVRTRHVRLDMFDAKLLNELFAAMRAEAEAVVRPAAPGETLVESRQAFMRYRGQGHEIAVPLPNEPFAADAAGELRRRFEATYGQVFGRAIPRLEVEALTWTLSLATDRPLPPPAGPVPGIAAPAPSGYREVFDPVSGLQERAALHERRVLKPGMTLDGPALIVEDGTTTVVPNGFDAHVNEVGQIVLEDRARMSATVQTRAKSPLGDIRLQVMWNRLLSVVEEQARALVRTAFSTSAREAGDISAGVFDLEGRMLAQAVTGTPGHVNSMARSVIHFIREFPVDTMKPGDAYVTNDPWKGTGHLYDIVVTSPAFHNGKLVALFSCTTHVVDIGGLGQSPDGRQVFHEGLFLPLLPLMREGVIDESVMRIVRANVREPVQVEGDIHALIGCNAIGEKRLSDMMAEHGVDTLDELGAHIIEKSRAGMIAAISKLPRGTWKGHMRIDGYDAPIDLHAAVTIHADHISVDYAGTSGASIYGINSPMCYTEAYTAFGIKCIVAPTIPNNAGTLDSILVTAPDNTIVNALYPAAVNARSTIGHMLPDVCFDALHQVIPGQVPAEGTSNLWNLKLGAGHGMTGTIGNSRPFMVTTFHSGGAGARPTLDGLSATPFPSGVRNVPVEITETIAPVVVWKKEYRQDSGGAGAQRGGLGQVMEVEHREGAPFGIFATFERVKYPARGRDGGKPGANGRLSLASGQELKAKGFQTVPAGERLVVEMPGGGGYGDPAKRDPEAVERDVRLGLVSKEAAKAAYGVGDD